MPATAAAGLSTAEAEARLQRDGANEVPERRTHPLLRLAKKFWGLSAWMIELIALISFILHKRADLIVALALLVVNALLSFLQEQHASAAVATLRQKLRVTARVLRDGQWAGRAARELVVGDLVRLRMGDFVPADLELVDGELRVDESALTGESAELEKRAGAAVRSGAVVRQGEATGTVTATGARTYFGRTTQLVETAQPKLHIEAVVARVVKWLFVIVGVLVAIALVASYVEGLKLLEILPLTLVLLMSAVPVALPVMFTVSMAVGSVDLAKHGVLVTQLNAAEDAANMDVLCADKTGTLTMNRPSFSGALPQPGFADDDVLCDGALASNDADRDPIDVAFLDAARARALVPGDVRRLSFVPFSPKSRYTLATVEIGGARRRVAKGALRAVAALAGADATLLDALERRANAEAAKGVRVIAVARGDGDGDGDGPMRLVGLALLHDAPRPDSRRLIDELRNLGVAIKMLTGDALGVAREIAGELGIGEIVRAPELRAAHAEAKARAAALTARSDGFAEVYPEDKFVVVESLQAAGHVVGMTGDGVNDAPALRQAEVGIAVSGASDVAKGAASVVLTTEGLVGIVDLVKGGRAIYQRVLTWIVNKVSRTILKSGFVVVAFLVTGRFVISALGMVLIVFMTDFVKIALSTDRVRASPQPETWNIGPFVRVAVALGLIMLVEALGLLALGWRRFALAADAGRLQTFTFETLLFFALFSIVSIRERRAFWSSLPSITLSAALIGAAAAGIGIASFGLAELRPLGARELAVVLGYSLVCSLVINDFVKTALVARMARARR